MVQVQKETYNLFWTQRFLYNFYLCFFIGATVISKEASTWIVKDLNDAEPPHSSVQQVEPSDIHIPG